MRTAAVSAVLGLSLLAVAAAQGPASDPSIPHLRKQGTATQLVVDGKPFLIRGGELGNSTATSATYLQPHWTKFAELNLNTVLVPVYWDLLEPQEGRYDFALVDAIVEQARARNMRLVLLWFASWKNSMSCYAPAWVKRDVARFPRAADQDGVKQEILSPFSTVNRDADARAFVALMTHLKAFDGTKHTVVMVQVENEIGMIPTARDHSAEADRAFAAPVPAELMRYLASHQDRLAPQLLALWQAQGSRKNGTWTEIFGAGSAGQEAFMAWHFARYTEAVTAAGKKAYPLPMFVNAALIRPGHQPGQYPSAGPLPHLIDVWRAGAPSVDFLSPDIYFTAFAEWARAYTRSGNALFIPEALRSRDAAVNGLYAYGALDAIGFSPFSIEGSSGDTAKDLAASFGLIAQLEPLILSLQGSGKMAGLLSEGPEQRQPQETRLGDYVLSTTFERGAPTVALDGAIASAQSGSTPPSGGLVLATGPDEFIIGGTAVTTTFAATKAGVRVGILSAEEGRFTNGTWENIRWLGGDQTHQGRHIRLEPGRFQLQRVKLYVY